MNILLQLIRGPKPDIVRRPEIINIVDATAADLGVRSEQSWWDLAVDRFPAETAKAMAHMRACEG
jgi:hypothetical protein